MPKVEGTYAHGMTKVEAADAAKQAMTKLVASFEATDVVISSDGEDNVGFSCKRGFSIAGKAFIGEDDIKVVVDLPMMAIAFKGLVKAAMDKNIPKHLES